MDGVWRQGQGRYRGGEGVGGSGEEGGGRQSHLTYLRYSLFQQEESRGDFFENKGRALFSDVLSWG